MPRSDEEEGLLSGKSSKTDSSGTKRAKAPAAASGRSGVGARDVVFDAGHSSFRSVLLPGMVVVAALLGVVLWVAFGGSSGLRGGSTSYEDFAQEDATTEVVEDMAEDQRLYDRQKRNHKKPVNLYSVAMDADDKRNEKVKEVANTILKSRKKIHRRAKNNKKFMDGKGFYGISEETSDCHLGQDESCPISNMKADVWNTIWPGGNTQCLTGKPYKFAVVPGDSDKLLIFFSGGGACWESGSAQMQMCTLAAEEEPQVGMLDRKDERNPFRTYTLVSIHYCSGDVHVGNAKPEWTGPGGVVAQQRGYHNAKSAIDWAKTNVGNRKLTNFVFAGASAGALAAKVWARTVLTDFSYTNAAVIADSFIGVFPQGVQGDIQKKTGLCSTGLLSPKLNKKCEAGKIDIHDAYDETIKQFPDVLFANINSKSDIVQMAFHDAIRMSLLNDDDMISQEEWSSYLRLIENFHSRWPNFVTFTVAARQHEYLNTPAYWWGEANGVKVYEWVADIPVKEGGSITSKCTGKHGTDKSKQGNGWDLCSDASMNRVYHRAGSSIFPLR